MKRAIYCLFCIGILISLLAAPAVQARPDGWQSIVPGIDYQAYTFQSLDAANPGQVKAYVTRLDRNVNSVILDSAIASGTISGSRQKVTSMAAIYDEAINYWGQSWGQRNHVVAAINGGFFDLNSGLIQGGQIQDGWYAKRFGDYGSNGGGGSGFAWKLDHSVFMGQCVNHVPAKQYIEYWRGAPATLLLHQWLDEINLNPSERLLNQLVMYTPQYNKSTPADNAQNTLEITVELSTPALIKPSPNYVTGFVTALHDGHGSTLIPYDSVVLSAAGTARDAINNKGIKVGDEVHITQEITNCVTPSPGDWSKTYASIDGNKILVNNGSVPSNLPVLGPDPRTAIAFNDSYVYFIVVDGRQPGYSIGLDLKYLGQFALKELGATWAINQDGGGSSTMVINGQVVNHPSDYCPVLFLPFISRNSQAVQSAPPQDGQTLDQELVQVNCQRPVANGMLMIQVEAKAQSTRFSTGDHVITNQAAILRLGPGSNYAAITTLPTGTAGTILADNNGLGGVMAKGSYRWKVDFGGGSVGWVAEETLSSNP